MIPAIELNENEKLWLVEAWRYLRTNAVKPEYQYLRKATIDKTGAEFMPTTISPLLLNDRTEITFLGVLHIEPDSDIFKNAEDLLFLIKQKLRDAEVQDTFLISQLADELKIDQQYGRIIFALLTEFGNIYNGATSQGTFKGKFDYDQYTIKSDELFDSYMAFDGLKKKMEDYYRKRLKSSDVGDKEVRIGGQYLWLDKQGQLQFLTNGTGMLGNFILRTDRVFISPNRIKQIIEIQSTDFDFLKLLHLCKEINFNYLYENYYGVALLTRALIDHIPPIFSCKNFGEVANNYKSDKNSQSFKKAMIHLDNSLRNIGDSLIHSQIRKSEVSPNEIQSDFRNDLDVLLSEIVRILKN